MSVISQKLRLLIVEDDAIDFRRLREGLRKHRPDRYFGKHAPNMEQASSILAEEVFDIVLLDISLPDSSGVEELESVQQLAPRSQIIFLGSSSDIETGIAAVSSGAEDFLVKEDLSADRLVQAIEYAVARRQYQQNADTEGALLRAIYDQITELVIVVDASGNLRAGHDNLRRILGHQPDQLHFRTWIGLLHPEDQAVARAAWNRVLAGAGDVQQLVARLPMLDGVWHAYHLTLTNRLDEPSVGGVLINGSDVADAVAHRSMGEQFSQLSRILISAPEPDSAIRAALQLIGKSFAVDEIRLFQYDESDPGGQLSAHQLYAWSSYDSSPGRLPTVAGRAIVDAGVHE